MPSGMRVLSAISGKAQEWVDGNVAYKDWQLVCGGIAGDWRMMDAIREAMLDEGFRDNRRRWEFWRKPDFQIL